MLRIRDRKNSDSFLTFEYSLKECKALFELGVRSNYLEAIDKLSKWSSISIYHASTKLFLLGLKSCLTLQKTDMEETIANAEALLDMCEKRCKKVTLASKVWHLFRRDNYARYSDEQVHALLLKGMAMVMLGNQTLTIDHNLMSLVKAALHLQGAYSILKTKWKSELSRNFFESSLQMHEAMSALMISHLPERVTKFLTWFGFDADQTKAMDTIDRISREGTSFLAMGAKIGLGMYECVFVPILGCRPSNTTKIFEITDDELAVFNMSSWALLFKALALKLNGEIDCAIIYYNRTIDSQRELKQLHNICHWDLAFCHGLKMDWELAAKHADLLFDQCNWSRATFVYMKAAFLYMKMIDENRPEDMEEQISQLFKLVPQLKQRFAGKTIPPEKYVCVNAEKYFLQNKSLPLPAFDLFYLWNVYSWTVNNPRLVDPIITRINEYLFIVLNQYANNSYPIEDYCLLQLIKGICLKYQNRNELAENAFYEIFRNENHLEHNRNLMPMALLEMGLTKFNAKNYAEAEIWLKKAQKCRRYFFKMIIHFRAHSALQCIKQIKERELLRIAG